MVSRKDKQRRQYLTVKVKYLAMPDADARLAQAIELLLNSAAMNDTTSREDTASKAKESFAYDADGKSLEQEGGNKK